MSKELEQSKILIMHQKFWLDIIQHHIVFVFFLLAWQIAGPFSEVLSAHDKLIRLSP